MSQPVSYTHLLGRIYDSLIVLVLCFIGMSILQMPYALLISVVVGVTNIIPVFGPFLGGVPSALILLMVDPMKGLWFIIFIIVLQQVDGNIICPLIVGAVSYTHLAMLNADKKIPVKIPRKNVPRAMSTTAQARRPPLWGG